MSGHDIVVIGGSAGALEPLRSLLAALPRNLPAALFVVIHMPPVRETSIPAILKRGTTLDVRLAEDGDDIVNGRVLIAAPDHHLIVHEGRVRLSRGPRENYWRPSIDVLLRTAAVAYGPRVVGVLLSGALDDGTAGLHAIRRCGGKAYAQAPYEAAFPEMPDNARYNVEGVQSMPINEIAAELVRLAAMPAPAAVEIPDDLRMEARVAEDLSPKVAKAVSEIAEPSAATCPECNGPLFTPKDGLQRFRCLVGHAVGQRSLLNGMRQEVESSLWSAIRLLQQRATLCRGSARREHDSGRMPGATTYDERATEAEGQANLLRELLLGLSEPQK